MSLSTSDENTTKDNCHVKGDFQSVLNTLKGLLMFFVLIHVRHLKMYNFTTNAMLIQFYVKHHYRVIKCSCFNLSDIT